MGVCFSDAQCGRCEVCRKWGLLETVRGFSLALIVVVTATSCGVSRGPERALKTQSVPVAGEKTDAPQVWVSLNALKEKAEAAPGPGMVPLGLSEITAVAWSPKANEVSLVGRNDPAAPPIYLDDVVAMLRATNGPRYPLVSLEPEDHDRPSGMQKVILLPDDVGFQYTRMGQVMVDADYVTKAMAMAAADTAVTASTSLKKEFEKLVRSCPTEQVAGTVRARVWFVPAKAKLRRETDGDKELLWIDRAGYVMVSGTKVFPKDGDDAERTIETPVNAFAEVFNRRFKEFNEVRAFREFGNVFTLALVAEQLHYWQGNAGGRIPDYAYWLKEYRLEPVETPKEFRAFAPIEVSRTCYGRPTHYSGTKHYVELAGGALVNYKGEFGGDGEVRSEPDVGSVIGGRQDSARTGPRTAYIDPSARPGLELMAGSSLSSYAPQLLRGFGQNTWTPGAPSRMGAGSGPSTPRGPEITRSPTPPPSTGGLGVGTTMPTPSPGLSSTMPDNSLQRQIEKMQQRQFEQQQKSSTPSSIGR